MLDRWLRNETDSELWDILASVALFSAIPYNYPILSALYHGLQGEPAIIGGWLIYGAVFAAMLVVGVRLLNTHIRIRAARFAFASLALFLTSRNLKSALLPDLKSVPVSVGALIGTIGVVLSYYACTRLTSWEFTRVRRAVLLIVFFGVVWPLVQICLSRPIRIQMANVFGKTPTAVLILDEMDSAFGEELKTAANSSRVSISEIAYVDSETVRAIPAMFGAYLGGSSWYCAPITLCGSSSEIFSFSRLAFDQNDDVHITGYWHPYCAASGWESCTQSKFPSTSAVDFAIELFLALPLINRVSAIRDKDVELGRQRASWKYLQEATMTAALRSVFWEIGGVLISHVALPHPPGPAPDSGIAIDYRANVHRASLFVRSVYQKGVQKWGSNFRLVVTSDHPLRRQFWCESTLYRSDPSCHLRTLRPSERSTGRVPWIVMGLPTPVESAPRSNQNIFLPVR